jgi:predicted membrane protein (TIGR00267 family)
LGLAPVEGSPLLAGVVVGFSYVVAAAVPLAPYVLVGGLKALAVSMALTAAALLAVGIGKARLTQRPQLRGGVETMVAGLVGTAVCYGIGQLGAHLLGRGP